MYSAFGTLLFLSAHAAAAEPASICSAPVGADHLECTAPIDTPPASYGIHPLAGEQREAMRGISWHAGCPVPLERLVEVVVPYVDGDGTAHAGRLVVAKQVAPSVERIFRALFQKRFPIARMDPIEAFGGDDDRSMAANNTSGFNCRPGSHPGDWSRHAWGDAIDVNPAWNPMLVGEKVKPGSGATWLHRQDVRPGMAIRNGTLVTTFRQEGWRWGGRWPKPRDYQHFSRTGR
jgi:hypothetical protein